MSRPPCSLVYPCRDDHEEPVLRLRCNIVSALRPPCSMVSVSRQLFQRLIYSLRQHLILISCQGKQTNLTQNWSFVLVDTHMSDQSQCRATKSRFKSIGPLAVLYLVMDWLFPEIGPLLHVLHTFWHSWGELGIIISIWVWWWCSVRYSEAEGPFTYVANSCRVHLLTM